MASLPSSQTRTAGSCLAPHPKVPRALSAMQLNAPGLLATPWSQRHLHLLLCYLTCTAGSVVPPARLYTDPLHLLAYGSDASFYRLLPKAVVKVHSEGEVVQLLQLAQRHQVPVTFRAAGTSLSGQAITDSILIKVGRPFSPSIKPELWFDSGAIMLGHD